MKSALILATFAILLNFINAQAQSPQLTLAQQRDDFAIFRGSLEEGHGGLYYFIDKAAFTQQCDSVGKTLREGATVDAYYLKLRYLLTLLRHGHSGISLPGEGEPNYWLNRLKKDRRYLPLQVTIIDHKLYVLGDCSEEQTVPKGAEILSINGKPTRQLLDSMARYIPADGINQTFKTYNLYKYYNLHFLYNLLYPSEMEFTLRFAGGPKPVLVKAQLPSAMEKNYKGATGKSLGQFTNPIQYKAMVAPQTAYLKAGSFFKGFIENFGVKFEAFMDSAFHDMNSRKTQNLIIDLRDNEGGGDGYSEKLFAHITPNSIVPGQMVVPSKTFPYQQYAINLSDDIKGYMADPAEFLRDNKTLFIKQKYLDMMGAAIPPAKDRFTAQIVVLINEGVFSAGSGLVESLYKHRQTTGQKITFVGEELGSDIFAGIGCSGQSYTIKLPNSAITVDMPFLCWGNFTKNYPAKRLPDYRVLPTINGLFQGRDEVLEFALDRLGKND
ncbi:MAG: hypothetical protein EAZ91_08825 [Cytophagales bacterium]|nr:MAG: hypothetical protein EAZ91_08825 [Cytophagales bacterium]